MPCMKCANGMYKYGLHGKCIYPTLAACERAAIAIRIPKKEIIEECLDCQGCSGGLNLNKQTNTYIEKDLS